MGDAATPFTLPDEFVLLLHKPGGSYFASYNHTIAAQIGELVLRERVTLEKEKKLRLLDSSTVRLASLEHLTDRLAKKAGHKNKPVSVSSLVGYNGAAFKAHRAVLVDHGALTHYPRKFLGLIPNDRYVPEETSRENLIHELRQVAREETLPTNRLALLAALVHTSGLVRKLGFDKSERAGLKAISEGEELSTAVAASVATANASIAAVVAAGAVGAAGAGGN